jgi:ribosome-binding protein aMBF1 (putative translation factor)
MTEKEYLKALGKKIMERREKLELSREELAEKIKLSRMHIYRIEDGENKTNILVLRRIAKVFGTSVGELVNNE